MLDKKTLDLSLDIVFKTLWYHGNTYVRRYLMRMIEYAIGFKLEEYSLGPNEQGILSYEQIANKVDILLVNKDKKTKLNIEMNRLSKENTSYKSIKMSENKSMIYLANIVANFYNELDNKNESDINAVQVNFNVYYCPYNKKIAKLNYELYDKEEKITKSGIKTHDLYLLRLRDLCYNELEEDKKDFVFLLCRDYEEREKLSSGDKEREETLKLVKKLERYDKFMCIIDREEYEKLIYESEKREAIEAAVSEAVEQGIEQGKQKNTIDMIKALFKNGASIELIAKSSKKPIKEIKNILEIS